MEGLLTQDVFDRGFLCDAVIAFILPAVFSHKLKGHTLLGSTLMVVGGTVGILGTYFSFWKVMHGK